MRNLLNFLLRAGNWILFIIYIVISIALLCSRNPFHHSVYLTTANSAVGAVYSSVSGVKDYFNLRSINEGLLNRTDRLEQEVLSLRKRLEALGDSLNTDSIAGGIPIQSRYGFHIARVINNSVSHPENYLTLDRGTADGIEPEMGVVDVNGVVGIVNKVSTHTSRVISVLNPQLRLSCKVKGSDYMGSLVWDGKDPRYAVLEELPRHAEFTNGDTIITSGFSSAFPEGVMVGVIESQTSTRDDNFRSLKIKLSTDMTTLRTVRVVSDKMRDELHRLEATDAQTNKIRF